MQPAPLRLVQCIQVAFRASRPAIRPAGSHARFSQLGKQLPQLCFASRIGGQVRFYADASKTSEEQKKRDTILQQAKDEALAKPSDEHILSRSPEPPTTDPNLDASSSDSSTASTSELNSLPSRAESRRSQASKRFSKVMDNLQSNIFFASQRINDLTGYSGIEVLKKEIEEQEKIVQSTRKAVKEARAAYARAVETRSATQREVNDLLQRKQAWTSGDLERFTSLYRSDHANEQNEIAAQNEMAQTERAAEEASSRLARSILARYHEEQIWSDKIRQMSTWGTWGLMGLNVLLFIVFQVVVEPWRRHRLVRGFEEKVMVALERESAILNHSPVPPADGAIAASEGLEIPTPDTPTTTATSIPSQPDLEAAIEAATGAEMAMQQDEDQARSSDAANATATLNSGSSFAAYQSAFRELFNDDQPLIVTQRELTAIALEGAAAGAAIVGILLVMLRPR